MHITTNDISLIRFDLPIVEGSAPNEPKCNTHIHIRNTCTLDRCKQKRKKEEQKKKKFGNNFWRRGGRAGGGRGVRVGKKSEKFTVFIRIGYKKKKKRQIRTRSIGECSPRSNRATLHSMTFHSRSSEDNHSSIDPSSFAFQCFGPPSSMSTQRNNIRCISRIFNSLARRPERSSIFSNKNHTRQYDTQTIVLFSGHCSTVFDAHRLQTIIYWYQGGIYTPIRQLKRYITYIINVSRGKEEKE